MCLERLSIMDDPSFPTEVGDGEGDESEDHMYLSEARSELYGAIEDWEFGKDANMSRFLKPKHGYHAGEETSLFPVEFSTTQVGYLTEVAVSYKTGKDELVTFREQVPDHVEKKLEEMLSRRSIIYPK